MYNAIDRFMQEYFFLSNFYPCTIFYKGLEYKSSEAAFQAQKCIDEEDKERFTSLDPSESKKLGRHITLRSDWDDIRITEMRNIVRSKFNQHPELKDMLLETGDLLLVEGNNWNDKFWGVCDGEGENHLGIILMELRDEYKEENEKL